MPFAAARANSDYVGIECQWAYEGPERVSDGAASMGLPRAFLDFGCWPTLIRMGPMVKCSACPTWMTIMKTVSARQANQEFSAVLSRAERGEEILITKHNKPVAVLSPYRASAMTPERRKAIKHAIHLMKKGLRWGDALPRFTRDDMHDRE
jgi:prevent-host-death family protein